MAERNQQFDTFDQWVNKASSWLTRREGKTICFDARGKQCAWGKDFMQARDEGAFPVRWIWDWQVGQALLRLEAIASSLGLETDPREISQAMADEIPVAPPVSEGAKS